MAGYSKIEDTNDPKSPSKPVTENSSPDPNNKAPEPTQEAPKKQEEDEEEEEDGKFGKLKRNFSTTSSRFMRLDRQNSSSINASSRALQGALRRAFSVRSSSSEKYSRIYSDRHAAFDEDVDEGDEDEAKAGSEMKDGKKKKKSSRIIRACKRILGL